MIKVKKEGAEENEKKESKLTPEIIQGKLFYFSDAAHKLHLDTKSFAQHKALNSLYKGLIEFRDDISETLMGYLDGKRIGSIKIGELPEYSNNAANKLAEEIKDFAYELYEYGEEKQFCDIENTAQSLSGLAAKTIYLLTLT